MDANVGTGTPGDDKANPDLRWACIFAHQDVVMTGARAWVS